MKKIIIGVMIFCGMLTVALFLITDSSFSYLLRNMMYGESSNNQIMLAKNIKDNRDNNQIPRQDDSVRSSNGQIGSSSEKYPTTNDDSLKLNQVMPTMTNNGSEKSTGELDRSSAAEGTEKEKEYQYSATISEDKAKQVQDNITISEKAKITSMLLSKLSASELQLFIKMASNGLSLDEKKEAKKIILNKLTEDEYNQLIGIAAKYGLSEGKNYEESKNQDLSTK